MLRQPPNEKRTPCSVASVPQERQDDSGVSLHPLYITFRPEGNILPIVRASACVSSGGLSLRVAAATKAANAKK